MEDVLTLDLDFMGQSKLIASYAVPVGEKAVALIETGPASTVTNLLRRLAESGRGIHDVEAIFVTHVHLDHSGGAASLAASAGCPIYAHPKGVTHLVSPAKLLASAERLYGEMMLPLWGVTEAAEESRVRAVEDEEVVKVGEVEFRALHTPGHATHHVAWQFGETVATGDVGGIRFPGASHVLPPMPPPDIDVPRWLESIDRIREAKPKTLVPTHFGCYDDAERHLHELAQRLERWTAIAEQVVAEGGQPAELTEKLLALDEKEIKLTGVAPETRQLYRHLCPMDGNSAGLMRYLANRRG
jgi:glyoxylase-like metal-dependent hydrolase (beta-lactamase superfamily II)